MRLSPSAAAVEGKTGQKYFSGVTPGSAGSTWPGAAAAADREPWHPRGRRVGESERRRGAVGEGAEPGLSASPPLPELSAGGAAGAGRDTAPEGRH